MKKLNIMYEDNHILVVEKPVNVLSQSDNTKDDDLLTMLKKYLKEKYKKPGNVYLGLVHRLDRPVGGVMVFAKTSKAASRLSNQVANHELKKRYIAVVWNSNLKKSGFFEDYLIKKDNNFSFVTDKGKGKFCRLDYNVLLKKDNLALVDIDLKTGRSHQIRVQFSSRNHPLYGDQRYGKKDKKQIALFAYFLSFYHPITKKLMEFKLAVPNSDGFKIFKELIK